MLVPYRPRCHGGSSTLTGCLSRPASSVGPTGRSCGCSSAASRVAAIADRREAAARTRSALFGPTLRIAPVEFERRRRRPIDRLALERAGSGPGSRVRPHRRARAAPPRSVCPGRHRRDCPSPAAAGRATPRDGRPPACRRRRAGGVARRRSSVRRSADGRRTRRRRPCRRASRCRPPTPHRRSGCAAAWWSSRPRS